MSLTAPRLACFVNSLQGGGSERILVTLANGFAAEGLAVDLVLGRAQGPFLKAVAPAVRIVDLGTSQALPGFCRLVRYLRQARPPVLLATNLMNNVAAVAAVRLLRQRTRVVINEGSVFSRTLRSQRGHTKLSIRAAAMIAPAAYRRADAVVAVSRGAAADLAARAHVPAARVVAIYNPAITDELVAAACETPTHRWYREGRPVILAVGRLHPAKDYPTLLQAFRATRDTWPDARLLILGDGPSRPMLERRCAELGLQDYVDMPGFSANPYACMRAAAVYVLSSAWEGFSNTLVEALVCGCPVVSTDCPCGPAEILEGGRLGALVPVGDSQALARAMVQAVNGPRLPTPGPDWRQAFSVRAALDQYREVLQLV